MKSNNKRVAKESIRVLDEVLKDVAPAFFYGVILTYADNTDYFKHRKLLGISHNKYFNPI